MNEFHVELKICEGCGVLWLRAGKADGAYCRGCSARLAEFPPPNPAKFCNNRIRLGGARTAERRTRRRPCRGLNSAHDGATPKRVTDSARGAK